MACISQSNEACGNNIVLMSPSCPPAVQKCQPSPPFLARYHQVTGKAWMKGSTVTTECGTFYASKDTHWHPESTHFDKGWERVHWDKIMPHLLNMACGCNFIFPELKRPVASTSNCDTSTQAVLYKLGAVGCYEGKMWTALKDNIPFVPEDKTLWCGGVTAEQIVNKVLTSFCGSQSGELG